MQHNNEYVYVQYVQIFRRTLVHVYRRTLVHVYRCTLVYIFRRTLVLVFRRTFFDGRTSQTCTLHNSHNTLLCAMVSNTIELKKKYLGSTGAVLLCGNVPPRCEFADSCSALFQGVGDLEKTKTIWLWCFLANNYLP